VATDPKVLTAAELQQLANDAANAANQPPTAVTPVSPPQSVTELSAQPVMLSAADLKELLNLKQQFDDLKKQMADQGKIATGIGESLCLCKGCHPDNIIVPGADGYIEVKDPATGELLPYMPAGQHAA
jgi:hypothetical protein